MFGGVQKNNIKKFSEEMQQAKNLGYVASLCELVEKTPFDQVICVGMEIIFSDVVEEKAIYSIKEYIELSYEFLVDASSLYVPKTQIVLVWYKQ